MHGGLPALPGHMGLCSRSRIVPRGAVWKTRGERWSAPDRAMAKCPRGLVQGARGLGGKGQISTWAPRWGVDHADAAPTHVVPPSRAGNVNQTISRWCWCCWGAGKLEAGLGAVFHAATLRDGADRGWLGPASGSGLRRWVGARLQGHGSADTSRI